jgi:hypothetical protein
MSASVAHSKMVVCAVCFTVHIRLWRARARAPITTAKRQRRHPHFFIISQLARGGRSQSELLPRAPLDAGLQRGPALTSRRCSYGNHSMTRTWHAHTHSPSAAAHQKHGSTKGVRTAAGRLSHHRVRARLGLGLGLRSRQNNNPPVCVFSAHDDRNSDSDRCGGQVFQPTTQLVRGEARLIQEVTHEQFTVRSPTRTHSLVCQRTFNLG